MTEYGSNMDMEVTNYIRKKEDFMNYYKEFDSNIKNNDNKKSSYQELLNVDLTIFDLTSLKP